MSTFISPLAIVEPGAQLGENVYVGPFSLIGEHVRVGDGCRLDSHVTLTGHTDIGCDNRFWPNVVIGAEPQDYSYKPGAPTRVEIGNGNQFREGVTVNRGAEKEDGVTRIGNNNLLMSNSHVAHNCRIYNSVLLVNGVLLGGHVHVHDKAIISGNSVVHHFATVGTLAFVSGGCRVPTDIPPYMLSAGSDNPEIKTVNVIGMKRAGISNSTILLVREAQKLVFRDHLPLAALKAHFEEKLEGVIPLELAHVFRSLEEQRQGKMGRAREAARDTPYTESKKVA